MATECSWNDGSKTQYYVVILDQLQGRSGALEQAPESRIRGPLTVNGKYGKHFPKEYRERTDWAKDSYPLYARPDNGLVFERNGARFTNQYVVPYCPQLLLLFDCHINVEISAGLGTVKYLSKYIYKGPDRATMEISGGVQDEIKAHLDGRFIGPTEACWKIFKFNMHRESPVVKRLPIVMRPPKRKELPAHLET